MEERIRRAHPTDLAGIAAIATACFERPWSEAALASALALAEARAWLAEKGGASEPGRGPDIAGFVLGRRIGELLEIDLVAVAPTARRSGFARRLLETTIAAEGEHGLALVQLELASTNRAAAELYRGLGFVVVGRRPRYYPDGSDALLLSHAIHAPGG